MSGAYVPRPGSVPEKVIQYLTEHGGTLCSAEVMEKFGGNKSTSTLLRKAVDAGLLEVEKNGRKWFYSLPGEPTAPDGRLKIGLYDDGDVSVCGGTPIDGGMLYTRAHIEQLLRQVTAPHIALNSGAAAP